MTASGKKEQKTNVKTLFVGLQYDRALEKTYLALSKCGLQAAANEFQWNTCDGLIDTLDDLDILTALPVATYPKYKELYLQKRIWKYRGCSITELPCVNLPLIKQKQRKNACYHAIKEWIHRTPSERHLIILYSLYLPYLQAISRIINEMEEVRALVIVTDLPGKYGVQLSGKMLNWIASKIGDRAMKLQKNFHGYVLLTDAMKVPLEVGSKPYVVVEGIYNQRQSITPITSDNDGKCHILYAGTLHRQFGIITLLEAFKYLDGDTELWICGTGDCEKDVRKAALNDARIRFYGYVSSDEVEKLRSCATVLVNPRPNEGEYTKYSFPSKTMGYIASGKPVVMYKLDGIPDEYDQYLIYPQDSSPKALADAIKYVIQRPKDEIEKMGEKAREFICMQKNSKEQASKIVKMIENL